MPRNVHHQPAGRSANRPWVPRPGRALTIAAALAVALRLLFLVSPGAGLREKALLSVPDASEYVTLARNLLDHGVFSQSQAPPFDPDVFRTPVYPLFLTPFQAVAGPAAAIMPVVLAQLFLSTLLVALTMELARAIGLGGPPAALAGVLVALSPNLAFLSTKLITETLFTALLLAALLAVARCRAAGAARWRVFAALICGVLVLTRPIAAPFPLIAAWLCRGRSGPNPPDRGAGRAATGRFLVFLAIAAAVVLPWILRNGMATGRYILSTAVEHNAYLYDGAAVLAAAEDISTLEAQARIRVEAQRRRPVDPPDEAHFWIGRAGVAWEVMREHPGRTVLMRASGAAASLGLPISLRPLLVHCGVLEDVAPGPQRTVSQDASRALDRGRWQESVRLIWRDRLRLLPPWGWAFLTCAILFHTLLLGGAMAALFSRTSVAHHHDGVLLGGTSAAQVSTTPPPAGEKRVADRAHEARLDVRWLSVPILYFILAAGAAGDPRFRAPVEPILCILAAQPLARLASAARLRFDRRIPFARRR